MTSVRPDLAAVVSGSISRLNPDLDGVVSPDATVERVYSNPDLKGIRGLVWVTEGFLLFSDLPSGRISRWAPDNSVTTLIRTPTHKDDHQSGIGGMVLDTRGRLTVAGNLQPSVWRLETVIMDQTKTKPLQFSGSKRPAITILAAGYQGKPLNGPHDLVYKSDGAIYFTDPSKMLAKGESPGGVYRLSEATGQRSETQPPENKIQLLIKDLPMPTGLAFSPDETYLYVSNAGPRKLWMRYPTQASGGVGAGEIFYDASADSSPGAPGAIKVDFQGNVYSAGPGGVWIFSPEGKHLGTIRVPDEVTNLTFGDADGKTLYISDNKSIYRVRVKILGLEKKWLAVPS